MKKMLVFLAAAFALALVACTSVESAKVNSADIASSSDAVAVVQATKIGFSIIFSFVPIIEASPDDVVNKLLVAEAKALGGNKVELVDMMAMHPNQFPTSLSIVNPALVLATGIAVK